MRSSTVCQTGLPGFSNGCLGVQKRVQRRNGFFWALVGKEMAAGDRLRLHIRKARRPRRRHIHQLCHRAITPVKNKGRAGDLAPKVMGIHRIVQGDCRTIIVR